MMTTIDQEKLDASRRAQLNQETAEIAWSELARFFASGSIFSVAPSIDLVAVGVDIANDNKEAISNLVDKGLLARVSDEQAIRWTDTNANVWALVLKPWILVQENAPTSH